MIFYFQRLFCYPEVNPKLISWVVARATRTQKVKDCWVFLETAYHPLRKPQKSLLETVR